ncbi:MAG TPA: histidine kinase dimerization/phospho-acceptor domain-containing protein, partial [Nevskiaceae bacterium]|nr:histidine kinase dimerization/phospho-acceptor domain-containing protein [Nevskiaceae bacterium]
MPPGDTDLLGLRASSAPDAPPWLVLVVDDDAEVHAVTRLALSAFEFAGRPVRILEAHSAAEARTRLAQHTDIALILLDVVMETEHAGLDLVRYIRDELKNSIVRIVLRTGQPGQAPPLDVVVRYEIDDYRSKTEMTFERLNISTLTALRAYRLLQQMEQRQRELAQSNQDLERFAYVASHDLQAPLRSVAGFAQILQKRYTMALDSEGRELLDFVMRGTSDMQALINDLLQLSRVGRSSAARGLVNLNQVLSKV